MKHQAQAILFIFAAATIASATIAVRARSERDRPYPSRNQGRFSPAEEARVSAHEGALSRGMSAERHDDWKVAERAFRRALSLEPQDDFARAELANSYAEQGRDAEARLAFREALRVKPGRLSSNAEAPSLARYGDLCLAAGESRMAVGAYRAAVGDGYVPGERDSIPPGETVASVRLTAHGAAAMRCRDAGESRAAAKFLRTAAVPSSPSAERRPLADVLKPRA